jgi:putative acetyltransferase
VKIRLKIRVDDPRSDEVARFLGEHLEDMALHSPPESIHALEPEALCSPEVTFWTAWEGRELLGCAALLELDPRSGEIKSMRTATNRLRKGVASSMLEHMIAEAERRSYTRLCLETGSMQAFAPARALYTRFGFELCGPFANYVLDPNSVFMTRTL